MIFKSMYKNKRGAGMGGGDYGLSRVLGTKTTQKSIFFKMGVSLR